MLLICQRVLENVCFNLIQSLQGCIQISGTSCFNFIIDFIEKIIHYKQQLLQMSQQSLVNQILNRPLEKEVQVPKWNPQYDLTWGYTQNQKKNLEAIEQANKVNQQIRKRNQQLQRHQQEIKKLNEQNERKIREQKMRIQKQAIQKQIQETKRLQKQKKEQQINQQIRQQQEKKEANLRKQQEQKRLQIQKKRQQELKKYGDNTIARMAYKAGNVAQDLTNKVRDSYKGSSAEKFVNNTYNTIGNYKDYLVDNVISVSTGIQQNSRGAHQQAQAANDFWNGNWGSSVSNFVKGKWNTTVGNAQFNSGFQNLQNWATVIAPAGLALAGATYALKNKTPYQQLSKLYESKDFGQFGDKAYQMAAKQWNQSANSFDKRLQKHNKDKKTQMYERGKRFIGDKWVQNRQKLIDSLGKGVSSVVQHNVNRAQGKIESTTADWTKIPPKNPIVQPTVQKSVIPPNS